MDEQDVKIAVLDTKIEGIREQQKAHADNSDKKFDRMFEYLKPVNEWVIQNKELPERVKILWDFHHQNKGFLSATRLLTASVGGCIVAAADFFLRRQ